jgi:hypothetical protein
MCSGQITRLLWSGCWANIFDVRDNLKEGARPSLPSTTILPTPSVSLKGEMHENGHRNHG